MKALSLCSSPLDFVQTSSWISLVNDNHVDINFKEIMVYVYYGSTVNNKPQNGIYSVINA